MKAEVFYVNRVLPVGSSLDAKAEAEGDALNRMQEMAREADAELLDEPQIMPWKGIPGQPVTLVMCVVQRAMVPDDFDPRMFDAPRDVAPEKAEDEDEAEDEGEWERPTPKIAKKARGKKR